MALYIRVVGLIPVLVMFGASFCFVLHFGQKGNVFRNVGLLVFCSSSSCLVLFHRTLQKLNQYCINMDRLSYSIINILAGINFAYYSYILPASPSHSGHFIMMAISITVTNLATC